MADENDREEPPEPEGTGPGTIINVSKLFGDRREICLELDGALYRLRISLRNRLILQK